MRVLFRGMSLGYGSSGLAAAGLLGLCSCTLLAVGVFWLGGAVAALGAIVLLHESAGARPERMRRR